MKVQFVSRSGREFTENLAAKILGVISLLGMQLSFTRVLSVEQFSNYGVAVSSFTVIVIAVLWGTERELVRRGSFARRSGEVRGLHLALKRYLLIVITNTFVLGIPLAWITLRALEWSGAVTLSLLSAAFLVALGAARQSAVAVRGFGRPIESELVSTVCRVLLTLALLAIVAHITDLSYEVALGITASGYMIVSIIQRIRLKGWLRSNGPVLAVSAVSDPLPNYRALVPMLLLSAGFPLLQNVDIMLLAGRAEPVDVAGYIVASRLLAVLLVGLTVAGMVLSSRIPALHLVGDTGRISRLVRQTNFMVAAVTLVPCFALFFAGQRILAFYGDSYADAAPIMNLLMLGQAVNVFCGPVILISSLIGMQKRSAYIVLCAVLVEVVLCLLLIPGFGVKGAAVANVVALTIANVGVAIDVRKVTGLDVTLLGFLSFVKPSNHVSTPR